MVRLTLLLAVLAGPAVATCFGPPFPRLVHYPAGRVVENLSHTAQDVTYRNTLPDGSTAVTTMRNGLFTLATSSHGTTMAYTWVTPLPALADLAPGFQRSFKADMTVEHAARSFYQVDLKVLRAEVIHLGDCDYPVLVIQRSDRLDGQRQADVTLWLSTTLKFPLRVEAQIKGETRTFAVQSME